MVTMPGQPIESWSPEGEEQTRAITARESVPYKPEMGLQVKPDTNPYEAFKGDTDFAERSNVADVSWRERFVQHFKNSQRYGTPGINDLGEIRDAEQGYVSGQAVGPEAGKMSADFLREQYRERQAEYEGMKPAETVGDYAAAVSGAVVGAVADPLSAVGGVVKIGSAGWRMSYPILSRMLDYGASNAAMNVALNATVQAEEYGAGLRDEADLVSLGVDAAAGFAFGIPFGYVDGKAAKDFYTREAARAPAPAPAPATEAPPPRATVPLDNMAPPTGDQLQTEFTAQDLAQAQETLFGEVVGTRNLTPEQATQLDDYLNAGQAGDIPQADPETEGGLTNDVPPPVADAPPTAEMFPETPPPAAQAAPAPLPIDRTERQFAPSELKVDAKRFQFKDGGDDAGVTDRLKGVKKWDPIKSGVTLVWEDLEGNFFIADGHQRHGLASRLEKEGQDPKIRAVVLREADGVSAEDARAIAAAKNIAEGTGNAIDAAKILRSRPDMGVDLPPASALVRDAQGLASLSDDAFGMVINKKVPAGYAAQVGRLAPDPKTHAELLGLLAKEQPDNAIEAESMIRDALEAPAVQSTMEDMFGSAEVTQILFKERAQVLSAAATAIRKDRAAFATLVKEEARLTGAGNKLATQTNAERAAQDAEILATLQAQARRKGPVADALATAAKQLKDGTSRQVVVRDFLDQLRRSGEATGADRGSPGPAGREGETEIAASLGGYRNTDQPAFRKWFGDSKVVDESGQPLEVYHGTNARFSKFNPARVGSNFSQSEGGFFFTSDLDSAQAYADDAQLEAGGTARVLPVYLSLQNPSVIDAPKNARSIEEFYDDNAQAIVEQARSEGRDGIIVRGVNDDGTARSMYVAFKPTQIKSIFNRGTWDATNPNIAFSRRPVQTGPGLFDAAPPPPRASGQSGLPAVYEDQTLYVQFGKSRFQMESFEQASRAIGQLLDKTGGTFSGRTGPKVDTPLIVNAKGETVGHISQNGRVWSGEPNKWTEQTPLLYDSRTTPALESGADNRPQAVIPGAERIGDKALAERRAAAPLRPQRAQKQMDIGLFSDEADQQGFAFSAPQHPPATQVEMARAFQASQPDRPLDELYGGILQRRQEELVRAGEQIAEELGIIFKNPGIKKRGTADEKMGRKGYTSTAKLQDLVRAGFEVDTPEKADALVQRLADYFDVLDEGWASTPHGYFDRKIAVRFYDGTIGEIQVWEPQLAYAKMKRGGTEMYTQSRSMPPGPERDRLEQAMVDLYQPIRDTLPPEWSAAVGSGGKSPNVVEKRSTMAASSGSTRADAPTSTEFTSVQGAPGSSTDQARPNVQSAGRASQSQNFNTETSLQATDGPAGGAAQGGVSSQGTASARQAQPLDPLTQPGGDWRNAEIEAIVDGEPAMVPAGEAVDFIIRRRAALKQLMECLDAN